MVFEHLKSQNPLDSKVKTIFTDGVGALVGEIKTHFETSTHLLCTFRIKQNLRTALISKISKEFNHFMSKFEECRSSKTVDGFVTRWKSLLKDFTKTASYLQKNKEHLKHQWATCFQPNCLALGIQSSQRVESMNRVLTKEVIQLSVNNFG